MKKLYLAALVGLGFVGSVLADSQMWNEDKKFTATTTIDDGIEIVGDITVEVAKSMTVTLNGVVSGTGSITKTGAGTVVFTNGDNSFAAAEGPSIRVVGGIVQADAAGAFSTGSILCGQAQINFNASGATFANDITIEGTAATHSLYFNESATLSGKIDAHTMTVLGINYLSNGTTRLGKKGTFTGEVDVGEGELRIYTIEDTEFVGKLTCGTLLMNQSGAYSGRAGKVILDNGSNEIGTISMSGSNLELTSVGAMGGARHYIRKRQTGGDYSQLKLGGNDQTIKALDFNQAIGFTSDQTDCRISSSSAATLTIGGDTTSALTCCYLYSAGIAYVIDVDTEKYPDFVQTFSGPLSGGATGANRPMASTQPLTVKSGKLRLDNDMKCQKVPSIAIGEKGELQLGAVTSVLTGVSEITLDGKLVIEAAASLPFTDNKIDMTVAKDASITIPEGMTISLKSLTVDGVKQYKGFYTSANLPQIKGEGQIYTDGDLPTKIEATWTAGGADDTSIGTAANWDKAVPSFTGYSLDATFASAGTEALVDRKLEICRLAFDAPNGFALKAGANGEISIGADGLVIAAKQAEDDPDLGYAIEPAVALYDEQTWTIPVGRLLTLGNGFSNVDGAFTTVTGSGTLVWNGTNTLAATATFNNTLLKVENGMIASVGHKWEGDIGSTATSTKVMEFGVGTVGTGIELANGVIEKTIRINTSKASVPFLVSKEGTTNEVSGYIRQAHNASTGFRVETNSVLTLSGGYMCSGTLTSKYGPGTLRIKNRSFGAQGGTLGFMCTEGALIFDGQSSGINNCLPIGGTRGSTSSVEFNVDNVAPSARLFVGEWESGNKFYPQTSGSCEAEFHGTTQSFRQLLVGPTATLHGDAGSLVCVTGNQDDSMSNKGTVEIIPSASTRSVQGRIEGALSLQMGGTGTLLLKSQDFASTGDLIVTNGVLELAADASWANGANVIVSGNGCLKLNAKQNLSKTVTKLQVSENGTVDIAAGVRVAVAEAWVGGVKLEDGVYVKSDANPWLTGEGILRVGQTGLVLIVQ